MISMNYCRCSYDHKLWNVLHSENRNLPTFNFFTLLEPPATRNKPCSIRITAFHHIPTLSLLLPPSIAIRSYFLHYYCR